MQSNSGAYEILYWDAIKGQCLRATKDSTESDTVSTAEAVSSFFILK